MPRLTNAAELATLAALSEPSVPTAPAAEFKTPVIGNRLSMQNAIRHRSKITFLAASLAVMVGQGTALAQSGSAGGSIGNDEKSLSGSRSAEPERPARRSKPEAEEPRRSTSRRGGGGGGGGGNFDGAWIVVSTGTTCSGSSTTAVVVSSGKIIGEGLSGSVSPSGATSSVGNYWASPSSVPAMFPAAAAPERSSDPTDASGAGPRRNSETTVCL